MNHFRFRTKAMTVVLSIVLLMSLIVLPPIQASAASPKYYTGNYTPSDRDGLNIRAGASTKYRVLTAIPYGKSFKVTAVSGDWGKTTYNGKTGYVSLRYAKRLSPIPAPQPKYQLGNYTPADRDGLNLRAGAGAQHRVLTAIPYGKSFKVTAISGDWGKTTYNGKTGYVSLRYAKLIVSKPAPKPTTTVTAYPKAVYALVQSNKTWAHGTCTITAAAIAMRMRLYDQGKDYRKVTESALKKAGFWRNEALPFQFSYAGLRVDVQNVGRYPGKRLNMILSALKKYGPIVIWGGVGDAYHAVVLVKYDKGVFHVVDPINGKMTTINKTSVKSINNVWQYWYVKR